jgi:hypothetical protein
MLKFNEKLIFDKLEDFSRPSYSNMRDTSLQKFKFLCVVLYYTNLLELITRLVEKMTFLILIGLSLIFSNADVLECEQALINE